MSYIFGFISVAATDNDGRVTEGWISSDDPFNVLDSRNYATPVLASWAQYEGEIKEVLEDIFSDGKWTYDRLGRKGVFECVETVIHDGVSYEYELRFIQKLLGLQGYMEVPWDPTGLM